MNKIITGYRAGVGNLFCMRAEFRSQFNHSLNNRYF